MMLIMMIRFRYVTLPHVAACTDNFLPVVSKLIVQSSLFSTPCSPTWRHIHDQRATNEMKKVETGCPVRIPDPSLKLTYPSGSSSFRRCLRHRRLVSSYEVPVRRTSGGFRQQGCDELIKLDLYGNHNQKINITVRLSW